MSNHPYSPAYFAQLQANYRAGKPGVWKRIALLREFLEHPPATPSWKRASARARWPMNWPRRAPR